jgi:dCTP diphosphatase
VAQAQAHRNNAHQLSNRSGDYTHTKPRRETIRGGAIHFCHFKTSKSSQDFYWRFFILRRRMGRMPEIKKFTKAILAFRDERNWRQFHTPKDLAISLSLEAGEVLEHFQWKKDADVEKYVKENREAIGDELADVLIYLLQLAESVGVDLAKAVPKKMKKNALKYPVVKAKGTAEKYNKLQYQKS